MNHVVLIGRLTDDATLKYFPSGIALSRFSLAINRAYKKNNQTITDFIPIEVWGRRAEYCATYFQKGMLVAIHGELHFDKIAEDDLTKTYAKVVAESVKKLSTPASLTSSIDGSSIEINPPNNEANSEDNSLVLDGGDIPF